MQNTCTAIVLAGGQGKRLFPLTINHCKPAVPFGGRYRLIDIPISNAINSNIRKIFVIAQYLTAELQHHLHQTYHFDAFNPGSLDMLTPEEKPEGEKLWFEGTADAIRQCLNTILKDPAEYFLILSGDQLYNIDFTKMLQCAIENDADLTIAAFPIKEEEAKRMGLLKINGGCFLTDFIEKPQDKKTLEAFALKESFFKKWQLKQKDDCKYLGSMGIYIFKREALVRLLKEDPREDFGKHLIPTEIKKGKAVAYLYRGYWEDIGTIHSFYEANLALTTREYGIDLYNEKNPIFSGNSHLPGPKIFSTQIENSLLSEGSIIQAKTVTNSIIGVRCQIGFNSIITNSIIMGTHFYVPPTKLESGLPERFGIGENCLIKNAIIDEHVLIGNNVKLTNKNNLTLYDGEGIFIRDGILVVCYGTTIPDNFEL